MKLNRKKKIAIGFALAFVVVSTFIIPSIYDRRLEIIQNPYVARFIPLYKSLRKLPDVLFFPYHFRESSLEAYSLNISPENLNRLNSSLPSNPYGIKNSLDDSSKTWVKANFSSGDYQSEVKVRYRGNAPNHWNSYKKSYLIEFPDENLFRGMKLLNLVIPSDRKYVSMSLNNWRAERYDLITTDESYVKISINGVDMGVYLAFERWSQEWLEKLPLSANSTILGVADAGPEFSDISVYSKEGINLWKSWNNPEVVGDLVSTLSQIVSNTSDKDFEKYSKLLLDVDSFLVGDVMSILSGGYHNDSDGPIANNSIIIFDGTTGRFKKVPYNTIIFYDQDTYFGSPSNLTKRLLKITEFRERRNNIFKDEVEKNKTKDITKLDSLIKKLKPEYLGDNAKNQNNFSFLSELSKIRKAAEVNYSDPYGMLNEHSETTPVDKSRLVFTDSFKYLPNTILTKEEFVRENPQFYVSGEDIVLGPGSHYILRTTIVPTGYRLVISPGASLYMAKDVSLVSYSPVILKGRQYAKIRFSSTRPGESWGVFAVLNTGDEQNIIQYTEFSGGGETTINGVYYSGMLAMHNADGEVSYSMFEQNFGDDQLNVKGGNVRVENNKFNNSFSDGIDFDYVADESTLLSNVFTNIGGDGIDLSWTDIEIKNNFVKGCVDKGISVGERSMPKIINNTIEDCSIGIAVKDQSEAIIKENEIRNNHIGISLYQKKPIFGGATVKIFGNQIKGNDIDYNIDPKSKVIEISSEEVN